MRKAVILKCPPSARFHFGLTGLDENSSLYQTSEMLHSDTLFSAMMVTCSRLFGSDKTDELREAIEDNKISFSSAFYFLENSKEDRVYFLPKPDYFELLNKDAQQRKVIRKIAFISKGVWEKGITLKDWKLKMDENGAIISDCVILQGKFVALKSEMETLFAIDPSKNQKLTKLDVDQLKVFKTGTAPKIADHFRRRTNNIFFQTDLHFGYNKINGQEILPHFYFLLEVENEKLEDLVKTILDVITDEGIGGAISTGCGRLACDGEAKWEDFSINYQDGKVSTKGEISLSLISPDGETELAQIPFYKILTRGGRPLARGGRLERVKMIKEGAMVKSNIQGNIPKLKIFDEGKELPSDVPYYRNGKAFCISIHQNYELHETT